jgi:multidrug resistance efflux pump
VKTLQPASDRHTENGGYEALTATNLTTQLDLLSVYLGTADPAHPDPRFDPSASLRQETVTDPQPSAVVDDGRSIKSSTSQTPADCQKQLRAVLIGMAESAKRSECVENLVRGLASIMPGTEIRCAIGSSRLRSFFDDRHGWLGPESALQRELATRWESLTGNAAQSSRVDSQSVICLARHGFSDRGLIWISGDSVSAELHREINEWAPALAAVLWSRPRRVLPLSPAILKPHHWSIVAAAVTAVVLFCVPVRYRVTCNVKVEPLAPRTVSAPFEALVEEVFVHPGDLVTAGQTLLKLAGRALRLERQSIEAEIQQSLKQKDIAMATGKVAESQQAQLRYQQLSRQRDLIDRRLEQLDVVSPIDGIIVSGDLRRVVGAPLELGRPLMEIAPLDRVLVEIEIPEYEISMVRHNAQIRLRIDASQSPTIKSELVEIYPSGELRDNEIVFIAPLELDNASGAFRPGMTGKATAYGDFRPLIWPYIRKAIDQLTWLVGM